MAREKESSRSSDYPGLPARRLSALARAGFEIVAQPGAEVRFMVRLQTRDKPGLFLRTIGDPLDSSGADGWQPQVDMPIQVLGAESSQNRDGVEFAETVTASMNGASVIAVSALSNELSDIDRSVQSQFDPVDEAVRYWRSSNPNPTFLYDLAYIFEALLILHPSRTVIDLQASKTLRRLVEDVSRIAGRDVGIPILAMHFPAQVPTSALSRDGDGDDWPLAYSLALRVSFALSDRSAGGRVDLVKGLLSICERLDLGLAVKDPRPGTRSGNWRPIFKPPHWHEERGRGPSLLCTPATFVGPARVGSTNSIVEYLARWPDVFIAGCSIVSLNDLAFIHLQLCKNWEEKLDLSFKQSEPESAVWWTSSTVTNVPLGQRLDQFVNEFSGHEAQPDRVAESTLAERAGDYHSFFGYPFLMQSTNPASDRYGVWISWLTARGEVDLEAPLQGLEEAFGDILSSPIRGLSDAGIQGSTRRFSTPPFNVEYLQCREVRNGRIRAIGKLSFDNAVRERLAALYPRGQEPSPSISSRAIEDVWIARLAKRRLSPMELTVSWREMWLGHWSAPV
jgi:hypothetical protein